MGHLIVSERAIQELVNQAQYLRNYVLPQNDRSLTREFIASLVSLLDCKKPDESRPVDEPTVTIAVSELVRMQEQIAEREKLRTRVVDALINAHTFVTQHTDDETDERGEVPVLSESFLYDAMGKDDARAFSGVISRIGEAAGVEDFHRDVVVPANKILNNAIRYRIIIRFPDDDTLKAFAREVREYVRENAAEDEETPNIQQAMDYLTRNENDKPTKIVGTGHIYNVNPHYREVIYNLLEKPEYKGYDIQSIRYAYDLNN